MIYYLNYLKDSINNNYIGIDIPNAIVEPYLNQLKEIIGEDDYEQFTQLQKNRDSGSYHLTLINVSEFNQLSKDMSVDKFVNSLQNVFSYEIDDLKMMGIGTAQKNENRAYFIVCESDKLDAVRTRYELDKKDLHITLGFKWKDVFGVRKNEVLKKESKFIQLLKSEFYKNDNWNFIRRLKSFDLPSSSEIIVVSINDSMMKVKCSGYYMDIIWLEDGENFFIATKYPVVDDLPRLSETEIAKILNKK